jgi:hypothetical protein
MRAFQELMISTRDMVNTLEEAEKAWKDRRPSDAATGLGTAHKEMTRMLRDIDTIRELLIGPGGG